MRKKVDQSSIDRSISRQETAFFISLAGLTIISGSLFITKVTILVDQLFSRL